MSSSTSLSVVLFIDYMNLLNDARRAFCSRPFTPFDGQIDPTHAVRAPVGFPDRIWITWS